MNNQNNDLTYDNYPYGNYPNNYGPYGAVTQKPKNSNATVIIAGAIMTLTLVIFGFIMVNLMKKDTQPTVIYTPSQTESSSSYTPAPEQAQTPVTESAPVEVDDSYINMGPRYTDVFVQSNDLVDNYGNRYACAYRINGTEKEFTINIPDSSYRYLKGTFALSEFDSRQNYVYARITVFDENGTKIYVSGDIDEKHPEPINMCVNVSGYKTVKVMIEGCSQYVTPITLISEGLFLCKDL